jgi:hypothetical protein
MIIRRAAAKDQAGFSRPKASGASRGVTPWHAGF